MHKALFWSLFSLLFIFGSACNQSKTTGEKRDRQVIEERQEEVEEINENFEAESSEEIE